MASFSSAGHFDGRHFENVRAQFRQPFRKFSGLSGAPRDDDLFAEQRKVFKPVQFPAQLHHVADDGQRRRGDFFLRREFCDRLESAGNGFLFSERAPLNDGDRRFRRHSVCDERFRPVRQIFRAHQNDFGAGNFGDLVVAQVGFRVVRIFVAGKNGEAGAMIAVRQGNACIIRHGDD